MYRQLARLVLYSSLTKGTILADVASIYRDHARALAAPPRGERLAPDVRSDLLARANACAKRLLDLATTYGFDRDLWGDYLAFCLLTNENSFSLTAERRGATEGGSVNDLACADMEVFLALEHWDFTLLEESLGTKVFSALRSWRSIPKPDANYFAGVSRRVRALSEALARCQMADEAFCLVAAAYAQDGVGTFGLNAAFRIRTVDKDLAPDAYTPQTYTVGSLEFVPVNNARGPRLADLVGYELQKERLVANTEAFLAGRPANNVLLYGDAGTGKSTSVKALLSAYEDQGLRMIEIYKYQFRDLSRVIEAVKHRNYRFVIFIDDLSFEENEVEYKFLKAVIEGGVEQRPENVLIYATSNRRHLIREVWSDRNDIEHDGDVHRSDTVEEKLSLAARFGVSINYGSPDPQLYHQIVLELAARELPEGLYTDEALCKLADRWEIRHGGYSGRTAQQFIDHLAGEALAGETPAQPGERG